MITALIRKALVVNKLINLPPRVARTESVHLLRLANEGVNAGRGASLSTWGPSSKRVNKDGTEKARMIRER